MDEIWKGIEEFKGYKISDIGRVKSLKRGKIIIMKQRKDKNGYLVVNLSNNGKKKLMRVHRLVLLAFTPNPENKPTGNHIDADKENNKVYNLEWNTIFENNEHAIKMGLNNNNDRKVLMSKKDGAPLLSFKCIKDAEKMFQIDSSAISKCCKNRKHFKTAGGYKWAYIMTNKDKLTKLKREVLARLQGKEIYVVNGKYEIRR